MAVEWQRRRLEAELEAAQAEAVGFFPALERVSAANHRKVWQAFQSLRLTEFHFGDSTGYGYGDLGREALDRLFAITFGAEAGLVRPQIVSGTHALYLCLHGLLRPGDTLLAATGRPYDTLAAAVGLGPAYPGTLADWGIAYREVAPWGEGEKLDLEAVGEAVAAVKPRLCLIQRSRGYSQRPSLSLQGIDSLARIIKEAYPAAICLVDNCYGEFVSELEPPEVGADLAAGSLIKNPGGGIAPGGGYIVGRGDLVERVAHRLTAPGLGGHVGSFSDKRPYFLGIYLAPMIVREALKGAVLAAAFFRRLGLAVTPEAGEARHDIVQAIRLGSPAAIRAFCKGLQLASPVDSQATPEAAALPGYADAVIMAGGTFVQGSSIELSADAPLRPPYTAYLQGGLSCEYTRLALLAAAAALADGGHLGGRAGSCQPGLGGALGWGPDGSQG